jgi:hypothetical protein
VGGEWWMGGEAGVGMGAGRGCGSERSTQNRADQTRTPPTIHTLAMHTLSLCA